MMVITLAVLALAGCATTQQKAAPIDQVQNQVVELEQRMEEQEKEIVDLKYELKELSGRVDIKNTVEVETSSLTPPPVKPSVPRIAEDESYNIIRVAVTGSEVQQALKNAGLYDGKIDGKVGPRTKNAVIEFQRQHGLKADGIIGQKTWNILKTYLTTETTTAVE
jgi:murein L,D-transpeptidase YcbB/YkuD